MPKDRKAHKARKRQWLLERSRRALDVALDEWPLYTEPQEERPCDGCRACCTVIGVVTIEKPPYSPCPHEDAGGCAIYDSRPGECRTYHCLYQIGVIKGGEENRPDRLGVLLDFRPYGDAPPAVTVWEVEPGAADRPAVRELIRGIEKRMYVVVRRHGGKRGTFPLPIAEHISPALGRVRGAAEVGRT